VPCDGARRELAAGQHPGGSGHRPADGEAELAGAPKREKLGVLDKTDVVHGDDDGGGTGDGSGVLHVKKRGAIAPEPPGQVRAEAQEGVAGHGGATEAGGQDALGLRPRHVGKQLPVSGQVRHGGEQAADVNLVARQPASDGVRIHREEHECFQYSAVPDSQINFL